MSVVKTVVTMAVATAVRALGFALIVWTAPVAAATLTAASCSYSDVNANVGAAVDGDTVVVPAGNCAWNAGLAISKAITLKGAGIGQTFITNNYTTGHLVTITESTGGNIRFNGFEFLVGTGPTQNCGGPCFHMRLVFASGGKPIVVTANKFTALVSGTNAIGAITNRGVISGNTFTGLVGGPNCLNNAGVLRHKPSGLASTWTTLPGYGANDTNGDQNLYFETNIIYNVMEGLDIDDNGRAVIRYNTITNSGTLIHGVESSAAGGRYMETYQNTWVRDNSVQCPPDLPVNVNAFIFLRGGTALIHSNVIPDPSAPPAWPNKSAITFIVEELRRKIGDYGCWAGGYPAPRQPGWGYTVGGSNIGGRLQDLEPIYLWNNAGAGNYNSPGIANYGPDECGGGADVSGFIQVNREYFLNTAKPGYTPFTYPHPLLGSQSTSRPPTNLILQ